jgi:hypothetical protein
VSIRANALITHAEAFFIDGKTLLFRGKAPIIRAYALITCAKNSSPGPGAHYPRRSPLYVRQSLITVPEPVLSWQSLKH